MSEEKITKVKLGEVYRDKITGFQGVAVSRTEFVHACARVAIQPQELHEGKPIDQHYFDEYQLEKVKVESPVKAKSAKAGELPGGPGDCARRPNGAKR